jgi:predicted ATPase/class 3 adenylate cyclase/DNA-binding CsgD family transcriptional regulator
VLPTGTVTLLLGDVEGSTQAWQADPDATAAAVVALNDLVDELVGRHDGVRPVEQGEGDSFVAAFSRARDGLACALALQRGLAGLLLRVRMGVHSGDVVRRDEGNYVGPTIIRTARLRNLAHGGQTVVSEATRDLVVDALPEGAALRDLGVHRLKDLSRPERVFQLCHPDLPAEFPPLRSLNVRPHNLPIQRTTFIGRAAEITEVSDLVMAERLLTLTGSGGCGKTRLALQVAADVMDSMDDGVWFVDLAAVGEGDAVAARVAQALAVLEGPGMTTTDAVVTHLSELQVLLVVDNCEHVLEAAGELVDELLGACPGVRILATSRQPLGLDGELVWRVPSLSLHDDPGPAGIEGVSPSDAVLLFVERAARAHAGFRLDERNRQPVVEICRRLDGIPLAIELAAARVRVLTPAQIAQGLTERFRLLTGSSHTLLPRQQTLEASLDWSHALLTELERVVFRRLGVFAATFDLEAAVAVCAADSIEPWQVLDLLTLLVDKNLVAVDDSGDTARYRLLETMRLYARYRLDAAGDDHGASTRHRDYYLARVGQAAPHLAGQHAQEWQARLADDWPNLEAALIYSRDHTEGDELCRLVLGIALLWSPGGVNWQVPSAAGINWVDTALSVVGATGSVQRAELLWARSALAYNLYDFATMERCGEEGLAIARESGDDHLASRCLTALAWSRAHKREAGPVWEEAVAVSRRAGDTFMLLTQLTAGLGAFQMQRDPAATRDALSESRTLLAAGSWPGFDANVSMIEGALALFEGCLADAAACFDHARSIESASTAAIVTAEALCAIVNALAGDFDAALSAADRHSVLAKRVGTQRDVLEFQARALVAAAGGDYEGALKHSTHSLASATITPFRAVAIVSAAQIELAAGRLDTAEILTHDIAELARSEGLVFSAADASVLIARTRRRQGDYEMAVAAAHTALTQALDLPAWTALVDALEALAGLAADARRFQEAARLLGAASALRDTTGYRLCLTERDVDLAASRGSLGRAFQTAYDEGRSLTPEEAVAYARRRRGERKRPVSGWDSLTPAETQVVALVREGLSNPDIARRLMCSPRTVQAHLTHIYAKVGVKSRAELAARAAQREQF